MTELTLLPESLANKAAILKYGTDVNKSVADGFIYADDVLIFATKLNAVYDALVTPELRRAAADRIDKRYAKGDRTIHGCKCTIKDVKGADAVYDFTAVPEWRALQDQINEQLALGETAQEPLKMAIIHLEKQIEIFWKPLNDRIAILVAAQRIVETSSITGQADSLGEVHEGAKLVKEAVKSTNTVSIQIL